MKKIIVFCLLLASTFIATAQEKPNKAETLFWLKNYANDLVPDLSEYTALNEKSYNVCTLFFNENNMTVHRQFINDDGSEREMPVFTFEYKNIYVIDPLKAEFEVDKLRRYDRKGTNEVGSFILKTNDRSITIPFLFNENKKGSKKDVEKIIKAIINMAELSGAKRLPTVNKNTF